MDQQTPQYLNYEVLSLPCQGSPLSFNNADFQTAYKITSKPSILAERQERKNPDLYYLLTLQHLSILFKQSLLYKLI